MSTRDPRIRTLGHDSLAVSQERTENGTGMALSTSQNESQESEMQGHLPECWATYPSDPEAWCICDDLRACEQRVRIESQAWHYKQGYADALDAAEKAVETWVSYTFPAHRPGWTGKITAAIRALKEKP